jgi:hypothetical protein
MGRHSSCWDAATRNNSDEFRRAPDLALWHPGPSASLIPISDNPQFHSIGLMARVADLNTAGPGEDWVAAMMFDQFSVGTTVRSTDNGVSTTPSTGLTHRFLRLQRTGNLFTGLSKASAGDAYSVRVSATRLDLEGVPLQVDLSGWRLEGGVSRITRMTAPRS